MSCRTRIDRACSHAVRLPLNRCSRYIIFSDCHRGIGTTYDNFLRNQHLYSAAAEYYFARNYYYLELGDGEELWENRSLKRIMDCHSDVYEIFECFKKKDRFCKIYGNHDMELKNTLPESIMLENCEGGRDIYMIHGHQADFFNSVCWKLSRFLVRYLWKPLERSGVNDPTSAAKNYNKMKKYEKCMAKAAETKDVYLISGHSHRPRLSEDELYINSGSCVHPKCITAIEIENMHMSLVKWYMATRTDRTLYVEREVLVDAVEIV